MKLFLSTMIMFISINSNCQFLVDKLYYNLDTFRIHQLPLNTELESMISNESKNSKDCQHMKCLDGYRIWELRDDSLFLKNIQNCCGNDLLDKDFKSILSSKFRPGEVFANWINTKIYNQYGELLHQVYDRQIFEFDREFEIKNGQLIDIVNYDNRASQKSIYTSNTDSLYRFLCRTVNWELIEVNQCPLDDMTLIKFSIDENKKPTNLKVVRGTNGKCNHEIERVIKKLPSWDLYLEKGQPIHMTWNLPIKLSKLISWNTEG